MPGAAAWGPFPPEWTRQSLARETRMRRPAPSSAAPSPEAHPGACGHAGPYLAGDATLTDVVRASLQAGRDDLVRSFRTLEQVSPPLDRAALSELLARRIATAAGKVLSPWVYLDYYRLGQHLRSGGDADRLPVNLDRLRRRIDSPVPSGTVLAYGDAGPVDADGWRDLLETFQEGGDFMDDLEPPDPSCYLAMAGGIASCRSIIGAVDPSLAGLMEQLQALIVVARPGPRSRAAGRTFGGATTFFFRGGSFVHGRPDHTLPSLLEVLVHEYAHAELFVLAQEELLCTNPDEERHPVRIRPDPRPMNGILHSLYVMGRVVGFFDRLLAVGLPWRSDRGDVLSDVQQMRERLVAYGASSLEAVEEHGQLTRLGTDVVAASAARLGLRQSIGATAALPVEGASG